VTHEKVCYTSPFIREVIVRIDFPIVVPCLSDPLDIKISKASLSKFPICEPQKIQTGEVFIGKGEFSTKSSEMTQWTFHGKNKEKTLAISPQVVVQTTKEYKSYEIFAGDFFHIVNAIRDVQSDLPVGRIGIRYVNVLDIPGSDPLLWKDYINESALGICDLYKDPQKIVRAFHVLEYIFDETSMKIQFGLVNPDYPAVIKRKQFVLDLDAWAIGSFDLSDIQPIVERCHGYIQELFESSITDKTRRRMKPKRK